MQFPHPTLSREFLSAFVEIWRLWVPLLVLLVGVGWATRRWWGGKILLVSLVLIAGYVAKVTLRERAIERTTMDAWNRLRVPLPQATRIDGLQLAEGTPVRWDSERDGHLLTAELGGEQEVAPGIILVGEAEHSGDDFWTGTLARNSVVRGWKCAAGKVDVFTSGELRRCLVAGPQKIPAGELPANAALLLDRGEPSTALVHLSNTGMRVNPGDFWISPDGWFVLYPDGELLGVTGPITLRGVTFEGGIELRYGDEDVTRWYYGDFLATQPPTLDHPSGPMTGWRGDISAPLKCEGGHIIAQGQRVTIPITGDLVTTTHWDLIGSKSKPVLDSFHCDLASAR